MLRESNKKKFGWSLNTKSGKKQEYYRHLTTDFFKKVLNCRGCKFCKGEHAGFLFC